MKPKFFLLCLIILGINTQNVVSMQEDDPDKLVEGVIYTRFLFGSKDTMALSEKLAKMDKKQIEERLGYLKKEVLEEREIRGELCRRSLIAEGRKGRKFMREIEKDRKWPYDIPEDAETCPDYAAETGLSCYWGNRMSILPQGYGEKESERRGDNIYFEISLIEKILIGKKNESIQ